MSRLTSRRSRAFWVRSVDVLFWTVAAGAAPALFWWLAPSSLGPWVTIGTPVLITGLVGVVKSLSALAPELEWDREGIQYRGSKHVQVKWADYRGHRLIWAIPPALQLLRAGQRPITVDLFMFGERERAALFDELARHEEALPNTRLKLAARVD
jgi:hypothetical protein